MSLETKYQIVIIGVENELKDSIIDSLFNHCNELGVGKDMLKIMYEHDFFKEYKSNAPVVCLYFGANNHNNKNLDIIRILTRDAAMILPIAPSLENFSDLFPEDLHSINGIKFESNNDVESVVSAILESLSLLRLSRRLFISYKRDESSSVAIQLYERFEKHGFDVFLDTHSVRPGEPFQEELWHRMADTDIVVLINTPGFLDSNWTTQELAKANALSIGILQLIWPDHSLERDAEICIPLQLDKSNFVDNSISNTNSYLKDNIIAKIINLSESLRARSLASRQDNLITEFVTSAKKNGVPTALQPEKIITIRKKNNKESIVIPTVGVPQALTYNQSDDLILRIKSKKVEDAFILFDHRNIREKWLTHLDWLNKYLPTSTIKVVELEEWLQKI